jgi:hypothetical protein
MPTRGEANKTSKEQDKKEAKKKVAERVTSFSFQRLCANSPKQST